MLKKFGILLKAVSELIAAVLSILKFIDYIDKMNPDTA
jgi:hypothetical protein